MDEIKLDCSSCRFFAYTPSKMFEGVSDFAVCMVEEVTGDDLGFVLDDAKTCKKFEKRDD